MAEGHVVIAVLASGRSIRFGGDKRLARLGGRPLVSHILQRALAIGSPVALIVREEETAMWRDIIPSSEILGNRDADLGQGMAIRVAAQWAVQQEARALVVLLADMPFVSVTILRALVSAAQQGKRIACKYPDSSLGVPAAFPSNDLKTLLVQNPNQGARDLFNSTGICLLEPTTQELFDVDTPMDLAKAKAFLSVSH